MKLNKNKILASKKNKNELSSTQGELDLKIEYERDINGVGMGVLSDATPFLTEIGLARLLYIDDQHVREISQDWNKEPQESRIKAIKKILDTRGITAKEAHIEIKDGSRTVRAFSDSMCLAILEYYAFDAVPSNEAARNNYRLLAGKALQELIYSNVGYDPTGRYKDRFQKWHERIELNYRSAPKGFFSIFNEAHTIIYEMIQSGADIGDKTVVDISIGSHWSKYWDKNDLKSKYGAKEKYPHEYPDSHPQKYSNPQEAWCYPLAALGEYREWLQDEYIEGGKFANYINSKVKKKDLPPSVAQLAITAVGKNLIER